MIAVVAAVVLMLGIGVIAYVSFRKDIVSKEPCTIEIDDPDSPHPDVVDYEPDRVCVELEPVVTENDRSVGLSKYPAIEDTQGMLFTYDKPAEACIWMKDMKFPIDIVWLDAYRKIVKIEVDVDPTTYPKTFCSEVLAKYVIELNQYVSEYAGLEVGQQLSL